MDPTTFLPFPGTSPENVDADLSEIEAAVALVSRGLATRVRLVGLAHVDEVAGAGLAHAQASHVAFALERGPSGVVTITLGPRRERQRIQQAVLGRSNILIAEVPYRHDV